MNIMNQSVLMPGWMLLEEAAERWGLSDPAVIRQRLIRGRMWGVKLGGRLWIVHESEMMKIYGPETYARDYNTQRREAQRKWAAQYDGGQGRE